MKGDQGLGRSHYGKGHSGKGHDGHVMQARNTASFDPRSTLVRPAMRVIYGRIGQQFGASSRPDDVIVVPEFVDLDSNSNLVKGLIAELKKSEGTDPKELLSIRHLTVRMCEYFQVDHQDAQVRVRWHESGNSTPSASQSLDFDSKNLSSRQGCMLHLSLGSSCELAFKRLDSEEVVYFPQASGTLTLLGRDIFAKWECGESKVPEGLNVLVSLWGISQNALEDHLPGTKEICLKSLLDFSKVFQDLRSEDENKCKSLIIYFFCLETTPDGSCWNGSHPVASCEEKPEAHRRWVQKPMWPERPSMRVITVSWCTSVWWQV